jgi:tRNA-dihydrouridine synthase A
MALYAEQQAAKGLPLRAVARHMLGLYNNLPGARAFRRRLSAVSPGDPPRLLREAAALVRMPPAVQGWSSAEGRLVEAPQLS